MTRSHILFAGNLAEIRQLAAELSKCHDIGAKIGLQIDASLTGRTLKDSLVSVNGYERKLLRSAAIARIAPRLRELRTASGLKQTEIAELCGVSAVQVSRWEKGLDLPGPKALIVIGRLATDDEKVWWNEEAGLGSAREPDAEQSLRQVPILRDPAAAGTPRAIDEREYEKVIGLPRDWLPPGGSIYGVKVKGDSMAPILETGCIAFVDVSRRDAKTLDGRMVAARDGDGVTIKWLRKQNDLFLLIPQNTSGSHAVRIMKPDGDWSIVGEVVKWIGEPTAPRGK